MSSYLPTIPPNRPTNYNVLPRPPTTAFNVCILCVTSRGLFVVLVRTSLRSLGVTQHDFTVWVYTHRQLK